MGNLVVLGLSLIQTMQVSGREVENPRFGVTTFFVIAAFFQLFWGLDTLIIQDKLAPAVVWAAGMVSESLGKRLLDWINPMHEKAVALLRAEDSHETGDGLEKEEKEHPGPQAEGLPNRTWILFFETVNFLTYAATYTLPSVLPFVASAYPERTATEEITTSWWNCAANLLCLPCAGSSGH